MKVDITPYTDPVFVVTVLAFALAFVIIGGLMAYALNTRWSRK